MGILFVVGRIFIIDFIRLIDEIEMKVGLWLLELVVVLVFLLLLLLFLFIVLFEGVFGVLLVLLLGLLL